MYVTRIHIKNIRAIRELVWEITAEQAPGWHVVLGDNGAGKSSFVRAAALALIGIWEASALRQNWNDWLTDSAEEGFTEVEFVSQSAYDHFVDSYKIGYSPKLRVRFKRTSSNSITHDDFQVDTELSANRSFWLDGTGWFSASYGPYRRFTGGNEEDNRLFEFNSLLARHLSAFSESVALTESLSWLQSLRFKQLEKDPEGALLDKVKVFVNQEGFLPYGAHLSEVTSKGVEFVDGNGCRVPIEQMSDGYRSILSLTFELLRQLANTYGAERLFAPDDLTKVVVPGVVLIDEVDAHLHPEWQRKVGVWFKRLFPSLQFIVTTHSPLVCQAATTIYRLPNPGSKETGGMMTGVSLNRLLYGNVLEAYSTEAFGNNITRSDEAKDRLQRLAELNVKELREGLTEAEQQEQENLRSAMPTTANTLA